MKKEPLGDKLLFIAVVLIMLAWILGIVMGVLLRAVSLIWQQTKRRVERTLNLTEKAMITITKYAGVLIGALLLISILGSLLGWGPPLPPAEPGDIDRHP